MADDSTSDRAVRESAAPGRRRSSRPAVSVEVGPSGELGRQDRLPIKMMNDRLMVLPDGADAERRSTGGILIPATAQLGRRLEWAEAKACGPNVRHIEVGDQVLFNPDETSEVEVGGKVFIILRERDVHAVAAPRLQEDSAGLYL